MVGYSFLKDYPMVGVIPLHNGGSPLCTTVVFSPLHKGGYSVFHTGGLCPSSTLVGYSRLSHCWVIPLLLRVHLLLSVHLLLIMSRTVVCHEQLFLPINRGGNCQHCAHSSKPTVIALCASQW